MHVCVSCACEDVCVYVFTSMCVSFVCVTLSVVHVGMPDVCSIPFCALGPCALSVCTDTYVLCPYAEYFV